MLLMQKPDLRWLSLGRSVFHDFYQSCFLNFGNCFSQSMPKFDCLEMLIISVGNGDFEVKWRVGGMLKKSLCRLWEYFHYFGTVSQMSEYGMVSGTVVGIKSVKYSDAKSLHLLLLWHVSVEIEWQDWRDGWLSWSWGAFYVEGVFLVG